MRQDFLSFVLVAAASTLLGCGGDSTSGGGSASTSTSTSTGAGGAGGGSSTDTSATTGTASTSTGGPAATCAGTGEAIKALPACAAAATAKVTVPAGCAPTVDGVMHADEWADGSCFNIAAGDLVVTMKYADDALYLAMSGPPTCGCPMAFYFSPESGKNFVISLFDDPFNADGDRYDSTLDATGLVKATKNADIKILGPGMQPDPVSYEWAIPYAALGIQKGGADSFKMAITHSAVSWPAGLEVKTGTATYSADEPTWAVISAPTWE